LRLGFVPLDSSQVGVQGSPAWRALAGESSSADFDRAPQRLPVPPLDIDEGFESVFLPTTSYHTISNGNEDTLGPTDEWAAGGRCSLKFADRAGLKHRFDPHLMYWPRHQSGVTQCSFDVRFGPGVEFVHEWRDNAQPYQKGPSFSVTGGVLQVAGQTLPLRTDAWIHFEIKAGLGAQASGTWEMTVQAPGDPAHRFTALPCDPAWKTLDWLGFISNADGPTVFYLDNVSIHNRPQAGP
jgi:hypothetical protein